MTLREVSIVWRTVAAFAARGPWAILRAFVRFLSAPLVQVARYLPTEGTIVDAGCGQGHFLRFCLLSGFTSLVGFDPSLRGLTRARSLIPNDVILVRAAAEQLPVSSCQGIVALDVLYLLDRENQEAFLAQAATVLPPRGVLLIKTMAPERRLRQLMNYLQEFIAVRVLQITWGKTLQFRTSAEWIALCENQGFSARIIPLWHGYIHPHVLILAVRQPPGSETHDSSVGQQGPVHGLNTRRGID